MEESLKNGIGRYATRSLGLRFRSSHHFAALSHANFGNIRSTSNFVILVRFMNLKFLSWTRGEWCRNFKFTALASAILDELQQGRTELAGNTVILTDGIRPGDFT